MNRNTVIIGAIILVLLVSAGGFFLMNQNIAPAEKAQDAKMAAVSPTQSPKMISSIKEALMGSASFSCSFSDDAGNTTTSYIKNGMVRSDTIAQDPKQSGSVLLRDKKMYYWNGDKTGFMSELPEDYDQGTMPTGSKPSASQGSAQQKAMMENLEKYKESCKETNVADITFAVPTDVNFTDYSRMMKSAGGKAMGAEPTIDQKQIQQMMKQYAPQTTP